MDPVKEMAEALTKAKHAIALTGAGISTASGIPDFRGPRGLWRRVDPEVFNIEYFLADPLTSWRHYLSLHRATAEARPNPAHYALAALEKAGIIKAIITQNVDGLHQAAGSKHVVEIHGNGSRARCLSCGRTFPIEDALREVEKGGIPRCPHCGGILKPDVTFFGEQLPEEALSAALELAWRSDAILVAGSSLVVSPANQIPLIVKQRGGFLGIVNLGPTTLDELADLKIEAPVERVLPEICRAALSSWNQESLSAGECYGRET